MLWCLVFAISLFGNSWLQNLATFLKDNSAISSVIFLSVAYTLGVLIYQVASILFIKFNVVNLYHKIKWWSKNENRIDKRALIYLNEQKASSFLDYIRSRIRIIRATTINYTMALISLFALLLSRNSFLNLQFSWYQSVILVFVAMFILLGLLSVLAYLQIGYQRYSDSVASLIDEQLSQKTNRI